MSLTSEHLYYIHQFFYLENFNAFHNDENVGHSKGNQGEGGLTSFFGTICLHILLVFPVEGLVALGNA